MIASVIGRTPPTALRERPIFCVNATKQIRAVSVMTALNTRLNSSGPRPRYRPSYAPWPHSSATHSSGSPTSAIQSSSSWLRMPDRACGQRLIAMNPAAAQASRSSKTRSRRYDRIQVCNRAAGRVRGERATQFGSLVRSSTPAGGSVATGRPGALVVTVAFLPETYPH